MSTMIASGRSSASAAPVATRTRNAASNAKRTRADGIAAQRPSLSLLFTRALVRALPPPEQAEAPAWARLKRFEAVAGAALLLVESESCSVDALACLLNRLLCRPSLDR